MRLFKEKKKEVDQYEQNSLKLVKLEKAKLEALKNHLENQESDLIIQSAEIQRKLLAMKLEFYYQTVPYNPMKIFSNLKLVSRILKVEKVNLMKKKLL